MAKPDGRNLPVRDSKCQSWHTHSCRSEIATLEFSACHNKQRQRLFYSFRRGIICALLPLLIALIQQNREQLRDRKHEGITVIAKRWALTYNTIQHPLENKELYVHDAFLCRARCIRLHVAMKINNKNHKRTENIGAQWFVYCVIKLHVCFLKLKQVYFWGVSWKWLSIFTTNSCYHAMPVFSQKFRRQNTLLAFNHMQMTVLFN